MAKKVKSMKALVVYEKGKYVLEEAYPVPDLKDGEVLIRVEACGVCASDIKNWHGAEGYWGDGTTEPWVKTPFIPGHEFIGEVVELSDNYQGEVKIGDRVTGEQIVPCGECMFCQTGKYWMCDKADIFGFREHVNGAMAEYMVLPAKTRIYQIPKDLELEKAILIEPYSCAKHAIDRAQITNTDVVVISGVGTLGLAMVNYARLRNPKTLVAVDMIDSRLEIAKKFGADIILNPSKCNIEEEVKKLTKGYGCDIYVEATGHPSSVQQGLDSIRKLGRFIEFSVFGQKVSVDWSVIGDGKELDLLGSHLGPYCFDVVTEWIADNTIYTDGVVTHSFDLDHWQDAFEQNSKGEGSLKVIIRP